MTVTVAELTLRDYFAGQALAGDLASQSEATGEWGNKAKDEAISERAAFLYRFADAMIAAREVQQ